MVDVDPQTFNITAEIVRAAITPRTKAIVPVHLFGQSCDMEPIMEVAKEHNLAVVEDNAQALGANYTFSDHSTSRTGTIGHIGCTSFYPSKNLGAYGDGGAIFTNDEKLAAKIQMIANHGQQRRYYHDMVGVNSRLDSIQAAVLDIKLKRLDQYAEARNQLALFYDQALQDVPGITIPFRASYSTHVFHQYTIKVAGRQRDALQQYLKDRGVPSAIFYPLPLQKQQAYQNYWEPGDTLPITEGLCDSVLSLPMHTEMDQETRAYIANSVVDFINQNLNT